MKHSETIALKVGDIYKNIWRVFDIKKGGMGTVYLCEVVDESYLKKAGTWAAEEHRERKH